MTVFTKDPTTPEMLAALKQEGKTLVQVSVTSLYILDGPSCIPLEQLFQEWFVQYRGRFHAYRDGSHVGGSDVVSEVKVLTEEGRVILIKNPA